METILFNGRYAVRDAEDILRQIFKVQTDFQISRIEGSQSTEEDMKHTENKVKELEATLRDINGRMKGSGKGYVTLHAKLVLSFCPEHQN